MHYYTFSKTSVTSIVETLDSNKEHEEDIRGHNDYHQNAAGGSISVTTDVAQEQGNTMDKNINSDDNNEHHHSLSKRLRP